MLSSFSLCSITCIQCRLLYSLSQQNFPWICSFLNPFVSVSLSWLTNHAVFSACLLFGLLYHFFVFTEDNIYFWFPWMCLVYFLKPYEARWKELIFPFLVLLLDVTTRKSYLLCHVQLTSHTILFMSYQISPVFLLFVVSIKM